MAEELAAKKAKVANDDGTTTAQPAELSAQIVKQLEYYFGDRNLPRDKFMQGMLKENKDGWIPVETMLKFNKLKLLTEDENVVVSALRAVEDPLVEVSEDGKSVRRAPSKPVKDQAELDKRSIYAKGFNKEKLTIEYVQDWIKSLGCTPESVALRRVPTSKELKGSVFVQLATVDEAKKVVEAPKEYDGVTLEFVEMKQAYHNRKKDERKQGREEQKKHDKEEKKKLRNEQVEITMDKDCVIKADGLHEDTSREDLKDVFEEFGEIAWVDYSRGEATAYIRFKETGKAADAVKKVVEDKREVKGKVPEFKLLQDQEEKDYWIKLEDERKASRKMKRETKHKRKGGRGAKRGHNQN